MSALIYKGLISQSGTNAPTVHILENTIGNIVWSYNDAGSFVGELTGAFPDEKTSVSISNAVGLAYTMTAYRENNNKIDVESGQFVAGVPTYGNGILYQCPFLIEVYP